MPGEFDLIRRLTAGQQLQRRDVKKGVGDDAAVIEESERFLLFTCDAQVEGSHFLFDTITPHTLGQRLAAVNLSDIAAMGGTPLWALCSLFVQPERQTAFLDELYDGLYAELGMYGVQLIGGNVAKLDNRFCADLFLAGEVAKNGLLLRCGAGQGDVLCVTGTLGDSAAGLEILTQSKNKTDRNDLVCRHLRPTPRIKVGKLLSSFNKVSACMDISDGLLQDCQHLAQASGCIVQIDEQLLPISDALVKYSGQENRDKLVYALSGGEDYELLFTVAANQFESLKHQITEETGVLVTKIGKIEHSHSAAPGVRVCGEKYQHLSIAGFDHLR